jgi:hypothetical protein
MAVQVHDVNVNSIAADPQDNADFLLAVPAHEAVPNLAMTTAPKPRAGTWSRGRERAPASVVLTNSPTGFAGWSSAS